MRHLGACGQTGVRIPRGRFLRPRQGAKTPRKIDGLTANEPNYDLPATRTHFLGSEPNGFDDHGELLLKKVWNPGRATAAGFRKSGFGPPGPRLTGKINCTLRAKVRKISGLGKSPRFCAVFQR